MVICAGDPLGYAATKAFFNDPKPTYLRIGKKERPPFTKKRLMILEANHLPKRPIPCPSGDRQHASKLLLGLR